MLMLTALAQAPLRVVRPIARVARAGFRAKHGLERPTHRAAFLGTIPTGDVLEIGPFFKPALRGEGVRYFDVLTTDEMKVRAADHGIDFSTAVQIDHVSPVGDLSVVDRPFAAVFSSHAIEQQPDLVHHLASVGRILVPEGRYFLAIPDARYCFDHFLPLSSPDDVEAARGRRVHTAASVIAHRLHTTHSDPLKHWLGVHGRPNPSSLARWQAEREAERADAGQYIDVHAWMFSPATFRGIVEATSKLTGMVVERVHDTEGGHMEFFAVLRRAT